MASKSLRIGFMPLSDCAIFAVAQERGCFERQGLSVELVRERSWANIRDKVALGALDAAHMLAPMPLATTIGAGGMKKAQLTGLVLALNSTAFTLSKPLYERLAELDPVAAAKRPLPASLLRRLIMRDRALGKPPLTFATVLLTSGHHLELRYWLASGGIDPDRDLRIVVVPPPLMIERLAAGEIDGFGVGDPWNSMAAISGVGHIAFAGYEIWHNRADKVLGVNRDWAERNASAHQALIMALIEAGQWLDRMENRAEAALLLTRPEYFGAVAAEGLNHTLLGLLKRGRDADVESMPDFYVFNRYAANFPWRSHAEWYLRQMIRWRQADADIDVPAVADQVFRTDLYREAAVALGLNTPHIDRKPEGLHGGPWILAQADHPIAMGPDNFIDHSYFMPSAGTIGDVNTAMRAVSSQ